MPVNTGAGWWNAFIWAGWDGAGWEDRGMEYGVRVLHFADYPVAPWRNGRGETREIAASVVVAGSQETPAWRISMATIDEGVPFSAFPGLVRMLGVVDGEGIQLTVGDRMQPLRLGNVFGPFDGGLPASARPIGGSALDLGLTLDPARVQGSLNAIGAGEHDLVGLTWFVISLVDGLALTLNEREPITLSRWDTAALDLRAGPIARLTLTAEASGPVAYLVSISR